MDKKDENIIWFEHISKKNISLVGGKNASLGEMISHLLSKGINVPEGFAITAKAYWYFLEHNNIKDELKKIFSDFDRNNLSSLRKTGKRARELVLKGKFPQDLEQQILENYRKLSKKYDTENVDVAVRSSATSEDLPSASFAGQHETYLNISGEKQLLEAIKKCMASLFTDRAITYREQKGFNHFSIALSVGIQKMVRSDLASAGIMFTVDTETGFEDAIIISSIFGVGEMIVQGKITPDDFYVFKPKLKQGYKALIVKNLGRKSKKYIYAGRGKGLKEVKVKEEDELRFSLTDEEVLTLAKWGMLIEEHYRCHQDIEWAKDGNSGKLFIVQSRPETVHTSKKERVFEEYLLKKTSPPVITGIAVGNKIGVGKVRVIENVSHLGEFQEDEVLVTRMTDPYWLPAMKNAAAIVTDEGGKTCHSAIVSRELGIPAVVGAEKATKLLKTGDLVTVDCTSGSEGRIFKGEVPFKTNRYNLDEIPKLDTKIMVNIGAPESAFKNSFLPVDGVGLAREEFIINEKIGVHPMALYYFDILEEKAEQKGIPKSEVKKIKERIEEITVEHENKKEFFVYELAEGIGQIASAFWPNPVIVRFSDFKTNEYRGLVGGKIFEPADESNPMLGFRGASRYYNESFKPAFIMECQAIKRVREVFGLDNVKVMIPFCRTVEEGKKVLAIMKEAGLEKGKNGLEVYVMCEIPSNIILAEEFLRVFDGFSIGSNDLTQLTLGIDRDNAALQKIGNENNPVIRGMISAVVKICKKKNKYCGICGQAPSDYPEFAQFLIDQGIESISLNADTVLKTILALGSKVKNVKRET